MKRWIVNILLIISLGANLYLFGKSYIHQAYDPSQKEGVILSEMVQKTVESDKYKKIAKREKIIAIDPSMDKMKGGRFPYYFGVSVRTAKQTYIFTCSNEQCSTMDNGGGTTYSIYQDESPRLPFDKP